MMRGQAIFLLAGFLLSCFADRVKAVNNTIPPETPKLDYRLTGQFPHDTTAFTEGFLFYNKVLFESTGSPDDMPETRSLFGPVNLKTGKIDTKVELDKNTYFGEGIVFLRGKIFQLTYKNQLCFVYDDISFKKLYEYKFSNLEGWGLTTDGKNIIMSDGTNKLTYLEPDDFTVLRTIAVTENDAPIQDLNELEWIKGFIYANVWTTNDIVKIDPSTGKIIARINLAALYEQEKLKNPHLDILNGIAYEPSSDKIFVTGKLWSTIYQIDFIH